MCDIKKLEEDFFDFAVERVWHIEPDMAVETNQNLENLTQKVQESVDEKLWQQYESQDSLYHDQMMYCAYKKGFIDALHLFGICMSKTRKNLLLTE